MRRIKMGSISLLLALSLCPLPATAAKPVFNRGTAGKPQTGSCAISSNCISVDFDKARLSEVAMLVSEFTGTGFVFSEDDKNVPAISWSQQNLPKDDIVPTFIKVLTSLGLTVHQIEGNSSFWAIRPDAALVANTSAFSSGVYQLKNVSAEAVQKSAELLYGGRVTVGAINENGMVSFSGTPDLVADFAAMLAQVDQVAVADSSIASCKLRHISVRTAVIALNDLNIFGKGSSDKSGSDKSGDKEKKTSVSGIFPDYSMAC